MPTLHSSVVVIGATGTVGSALCERLVADGHEVYAVGRNPGRLAELADRIGITPVRVDLSDEAQAAEAAGRLAEARPALAVAAVGGWYVADRGLDLALDRWRSTLDENLTAHFVAARTIAPILAGDRPVYLALNGIASHFPCEGSIAISVTGAAQRMMLDVLAAEGRADAVSYRELVVDTPILMPGERHDKDEPTHTIDEVYAALRRLREAPAEPGSVVRHTLA